MNGKKTLIVITGPTAAGKTALSVALAAKLGTEVVSADSRQIFREMNIGTAKPSATELALIRHHFINSHSIAEDYDAAQYGSDAMDMIRLLFVKHHTVILCGGSGLYIKAVCEGFDDIPAVSPAIREGLVAQYRLEGLGWLQNKMLEIDPQHLATIDKQNPHRLIRALEVKIGTGMSIAAFHRKEKLKHDFDIIKIGLELNRDELYERIDKRMDAMIAAGLFEEAKGLYPFKKNQALQTVGYQEIFDFMDGKNDYDETVRLLKRNSRHYAKRQLTWFKRDPDIKWFNAHTTDEIITWVLRTVPAN